MVALKQMTKENKILVRNARERERERERDTLKVRAAATAAQLSERDSHSLSHGEMSGQQPSGNRFAPLAELAVNYFNIGNTQTSDSDKDYDTPGGDPRDKQTHDLSSSDTDQISQNFSSVCPTARHVIFLSD